MLLPQMRTFTEIRLLILWDRRSGLGHGFDQGVDDDREIGGRIVDASPNAATASAMDRSVVNPHVRNVAKAARASGCVQENKKSVNAR